MKLERLIRKYFRCWEETVWMLRKPSLLVPFFLLGCLEFAALLGLTYFSKRPLSYGMIDIIRIFGGEKALHYPAHFILLPDIYHVMSIPLVMVAGFILFGWAVLMMSDYFLNCLRETGFYFRTAVWNVPSFVLVGIVFVGLVIGAPEGMMFLASKTGKGPLSELINRAAWLAGFLTEIGLIYAVLSVKYYPDSPAKALRNSLHFARKHFIITGMVILTVVVIHSPFEYFYAHTSRFAAKYEPEIILWIMTANIAVEIFTNYFIFAATTYLALGKVWRRK